MLANSSTIAQISIDVRNGDCLPPNSLCEIRKLSNDIHAVNSDNEKYILCAHAAHHSDFIEPIYFDNLSKLLIETDETIRQCVLWAFTSTMACSVALTPTNIDLVYNLLTDKSLGWSASFFFRKLSENEEYTKMISDGIWISMIDLLFDQKMDEQVCIIIVQTISNIFRSRKSISNEIKRRLQILIMSDNVSEKLLLAAIHALKMLVIDEEQLEPETLKRLQELMIMSNETVAECAREFHYILHDKQTLSNVQHHTRSSQMKSELVATQNILISHSKEEFIEPTNELLPLDYLISQDDQTDQTFNQEHQSKVIRSGDHQPFYYTMMMKIKNLHHVARQGELTLKDFFYLTRKLKKDSYTFLTLEDTSTVHERIIEVLRSSAEVEQNIPRYVVDTIIDCLTPETKKLNRLCVDCLLIILGKQHQLENVYIDKIEQILMTTNDMEVKQKLIEIYADCASKGHHVQLDLESIQQNLQSKTSCVKVSYLFFKAVAVEKRTLSPEQILILTDVAMSKHYLLKARENCSWALAYNIKETKDKKSFSSKLLDDLGLMLEDPAETIRHSSALAVCYYADDNNCDVPDNILERLAVVSLKSDSHISCNILSVYLKLTKRKYLPTVILDNICNLIYHPEFDLRYRSIWILKCAVDNGQELTSNILKIIDYCLKSSESGVCNTAGMIFVNYWRQRIVRNDRDLAFALSSNIENLVFIFRNRLELNVRREALHLLKLLVDKNYDLTNTLLQLIEYCFYDSDASISICAVNILTSYSKQHILPTRTIICLENLLTTETANVADILPVLKKVVDQGHMLSEKSITHLGYLLLKIDDPNNVVILLSHVDRYQPLSKTVNDLLRQDYYTKILRYSTCARSLDEAISGFINLTANGTQLSQSVLDSLFFLLKSSDRQMKLMPIVVNVTENGQQLKNNEHICTLTRIFFDSDDKSLIDLVRIFRNLSRMNQVIPDPVIEFLENFLVNSLLTGYIIEIFQHLIERQKLKNQSIIGKVLKMLHFSESTVMNTEIYYRLVRFCKVVANNQPNEIDQARILSMLQFTQSAIVRKDGCTLAKALAEHGQTLTTSVMDALVHILNNDTDINIQEYALTVMNLANSDNQNMDNDFVQMLDTIDHQNTTDDEFLLEISRKISRTSLKLSEKDLLRLSHMLYTCNIDSKRKAASYIVSVAENGRKLLDEIFHIIYATLRDDTVNIYTIKLLLRSSVKQPAFLINDLLYLVVYSMHSVVREKAQKILADHGDNPKVQLFFNTERNPENLDKMVSNYDVYLIEKLSSNNENEIFMALKVIQNMITVEKQIASDLLLAVTLKLNTHNDIVADILCATMIHRSRIEEDIYQEIEKTFLIYQTPKMMNLIRILAEQQIELESKTIKTVFNILCRRTDEKALCRDAVIIMEQIARHQLLSKEILSYFVERISNESKEDIQTSFNVIRYQILHSQMDDMLDSLPIIPLPQGIDNQRLFQLKTFEQYLGTVQTLLFVDSFNPTVLNWPAERWSRECLCFDLLKRYQDATPDSVYIFYHQLTLLEISRQYGFYSDVRDLILQTLIQKQCTYSLDLGTISDLLIYLTILKNNPLQMLQANEPNWLLNMRRYYVREKMSQYLSDSIFSKSMIDHIVDRITEQENLPAELIELFLQTAIKPEHILIFLHLMSDYGLTKNDVTSLFASLKVTSGFKTLKKQMECFILNRTLASRWFGSPNDLALGRVYLEALLNNGWTFVRLNDMLKAIKIDSDTFDTFKEFLVCLKIIVDYEMNENSETELNTIFSTIGHQLWRSKVHSIAIENQFGLTSSEKNLFMLLTEIDHVNKTRFLTELTQTMSTIDQAFRCDSSVLRQNKPISEWTISHIQKWAQQFLLQQSEKLSGVRLYEIMAVIKRAIYLDLNVEPRAIQLVSVLIVLDSNHQRGRLLQILTGEGKSTIVSILAVIKALEHKKVDIVTSSMVLAKRDARKRQIFYNMFNLTVACNDDVTSYVSGQKACYQADIVYGTCSQFQFDILRHEYSLLDTRKDRGYDVVIIDEVDSMLIDENSTIARLADPLPGMEYLNPLLYGICQSVNNDEEVEANRDGIVEQIKDLINNPKPAIKIPCHLHDFVHQSIPSWVDHAIRAKIEYRLDHHYLIKTDEIGVKRITPIDYSNTGVIQCNTTFSNGAHQCLQIKHGLKMTPLTVTTNYMSNVGLFTRYKNQIYGFTGTLGSESAKDLLRKVYNVDTIVIPSFKEKRHFSFNAILTSTDEEWLETITSNTVNNMDLNRAVLIICETILDAKTVAKAVQRAYPTGTVHLYTDNTDAIEPNVISNRIQPRQIIVATNLVGRGTDLQTSPDVENSGGLHVCLTFLPDNLRVEQQALGRTSRQGNRGTSQMILRLHRLQLQMSYPEYACGNEKDLTDPIRFIYEWREKAECAHLDRILEREVPEIKEKDDLFRQFCDLLGKLRTQDNDFYKLLSVKERWALWSKSVEHTHQARQALEKKIINAGFRLVDIPRDANSLFHAVSHHLGRVNDINKIKTMVIEHIEKNEELYKEMDETQRHWAISRALNVNIVLFRSDYGSPYVYKRIGAQHTCFIGYEVNTHYVPVEPLDPGNELAEAYLGDVDVDDVEILTLASENKIKSIVSTGLHNLWTDKKQQKLHDLLSVRTVSTDLKTGFNDFQNQILEEYKTNKIIKNPYYLILEANETIAKLASWLSHMRSITSHVFGNEKMKSIDDAIAKLKQAIELDPVFAFSASVTLAYLAIHKHEPKHTYKIDAKSYLVQAQKNLEQFILPQLYSMHRETNENNAQDFFFDDFGKQTQMKIEILELYQHYVSQAIGIIESSQKLVDVSSTNNGTVLMGKKMYGNEIKKFILSLSELTNNHACDILENFDRNEHDVNASLKAITEHFMSSDQLYEELNIFKNLGVSQLIVINELHPRPWISVSTVALLGIGQIIGGVCLGALSGCVGGSLALSLIYEGVSDIYYAIKGAISRQLSFRDYAIQKGISLSICFISIGLSAVSKGAKAVQTGTQSTMQLLKQTAQEAKGILKNDVRVLTKGAIQGTAKVSWVLACEKVGITCVTTGIREIANYSLDITTNKVLSSARSTISDEIERIINTERDNEVYNPRRDLRFCRKHCTSHEYIDEPVRSFKGKLVKEVQQIDFASNDIKNYVLIVLNKLITFNKKSLRMSIIHKKIVQQLADQIILILHANVMAHLTTYIAQVIDSFSDKIQLKLSSKGTVSQQLMENCALREINVLSNDLVRDYQSGKIQLAADAVKKLHDLKKKSKDENFISKNFTEELALRVSDNKPGTIIEIGILAALTGVPICVIPHYTNNELSEEKNVNRIEYSEPYTDEFVNGHYGTAMDGVVTDGRQDCMYAAMLRKSSNRYQSIQDMRTTCAAFILTNPDYIASVLPAIDNASMTRGPEHKLSNEDLNILATKILNNISDVNNHSWTGVEKTYDCVGVGYTENGDLIGNDSVCYGEMGLNEKLAKVIENTIKDKIKKSGDHKVEIIKAKLGDNEKPSAVTSARSHAEMQIISHAKQHDLNIQALGTSKPPCRPCKEELEKQNVKLHYDEEGNQRPKNWAPSEDIDTEIIRIKSRDKVRVNKNFLESNIPKTKKQAHKEFQSNLKQKLIPKPNLHATAASVLDTIDTIDEGGSTYAGRFSAYSGTYETKRTLRKGAYAGASIAEARANYGPCGVSASLLSASAHVEYGLNNSVGVDLSIVRAVAHAGPLQVGVGLNLDTNASVGFDGIQASLLGFGFRAGLKTGVKTPVVDASCNVI
ncbi:unnamed protein product [Didymodactylos carnosus]|uniref:Protein translocase subunit SecA n=1 Tax=Didymodactylos carnosus TaxID=1234261 RepID=A0A8S2D0P6_9BILA|nr:unnamed protein product [Didymodactylos carnosus]CAF3555734.1 unnamed protein product [Didymodactylos carnosus]